jgi:enoyl-CoA hydratase
MKNLLFEKYDQIAKITINRPDKLNALNFETVQELKEIVKACYNDIEVRGIIITGAGNKAFVAGADINEIASLNQLNAQEVAKSGQEAFAVIENSPKIVLAAVNGFALGGGCELAMACHIRVASENAVFGQPEVNLGIIPGYGGTQRLTQIVGKAKAIELMCTADFITADEAYKIGLISYLVPQFESISRCEEILHKFFSKPQITTELIIKSVNAFYDNECDGYREEAISFDLCTKSGDFKEGTSAFLSKRKPNFE